MSIDNEFGQQVLTMSMDGEYDEWILISMDGEYWVWTSIRENEYWRWAWTASTDNEYRQCLLTEYEWRVWTVNIDEYGQQVLTVSVDDNYGCWVWTVSTDEHGWPVWTVIIDDEYGCWWMNNKYGWWIRTVNIEVDMEEYYGQLWVTMPRWIKYGHPARAAKMNIKHR